MQHSCKNTNQEGKNKQSFLGTEMASGFGLQSSLQAIQSQTLTLHSISFHLSSSTSGCYQETQGNCLTINIRKEDLPFFSHFLYSLRDNPGSLESLEFDRVVWEPPQVGALMGLLEGGSGGGGGGGGGVRRVAFRRNRFGPEEFARFCECLERNGAVREVVLSECGVGAGGAGLLAGALKFNESVEELQIWDDLIGSRGAEDLSKMIEVNSTLKKLSIFDSSVATAAPLVSAVLARNRAMEVYVWSREGRERMSKVVEFVPESGTLQIHRLDVPGTCRVTCALGMNLTVNTLDLTGVQLKSRWAKEFRWVLEQNQTLRSVNLSKTKLKDKGVVYVAAGLFKNQRLQSLYLNGNWFGGVGIEHLLCPLCRFSSLQIQANITLKSLTFGGGRTKIGRDGLAAIVQFLMTNESVTHLGIHDDASLRVEDFIKIFKSLERNASLRSLSFKGCSALKGEVVLQTIMEMLQINPWLESLDLEGTPLHSSGMTDGIDNRLGRNERTEPESDLMKEMPLVMPTTCRVFLCGQEYAGKSTLCQSMSQNFSFSRAPYMDQVRTMVQPVEQAGRRVGMKIRTLKDEDTKISMWNLAGHHDLFTLHDLVFPGSGSATLFLFVTSLFRKPSSREEKTSEEVEEEIQYWLRFIVSNSRHAEQQLLLPNVTVVLTNYDKVTQPSENLSRIANSIQRIRDGFQGVVEFCPTVFTVDARSSASVSKLMHHLRRMSKTVLQKVPRVYKVCNDVVQILLDWRAENGNKPAMRWKEFANLCQIKVPSMRIRSRNDSREKVETRRHAVASCLHQMGEVIYFAEVGCLILDFEWFCVDMLGQLTRLDGRKYASLTSNGFISRKDMEKILRGSFQSQIPGMGSKVLDYLDADDVIRLMLRFELCHEQDLGNPNSQLLLPSLHEDGRAKPQRWLLNSQDCIYAGRHLEYDDSSHMFLCFGLFRRLQVNLHNRIMTMKNQHGATYSLEKYLILININGIYIRVELGGQPAYNIDVLACSTKNVTETLRLVQNLVVSAIHSLCQGIGLNENIMRPECVRNLTPPRYRKTQFVSLQQLKQALLSVPAESMYDYQHTWDPITDNSRPVLGAGFDYARDLLSDDDFREVLQRRYHDLHNLANELHLPAENNSDDPGSSLSASRETDGRVDPSFDGIAKGVEAVLQRLKIIEQEIRDLKQEIQGLRYYEHSLLLELHRKVNYLVNYSIQVEERKVPNMFYFVRTENYSRRLVTNVISGMTALRLHMLCEYRREMHVVEDQMGCEMMHIDNRAVQCLAPYMTKFMKLLTFALKIGAHLAAGMGQLIPDLSRELAHLADTSVMTGSAGAFAAGAVGVAALSQVRGMTDDRQRDIQQDHKAAQQWVVDFLRDRGCSTGKDILEKFGLYRVRYRDDGQVAWICKRHMHARANEIIEVPM